MLDAAAHRYSLHSHRHPGLDPGTHLHRYLAEFDFRYNRRSAVGIGDTQRHDMLLAAISGKRLTYRRIGEGGNA